MEYRGKPEKTINRFIEIKVNEYKPDLQESDLIKLIESVKSIEFMTGGYFIENAFINSFPGDTVVFLQILQVY